MYPHTPTYTEQINKLIEQEKPVKENVIKEYVDKHKHVANEAAKGEDYYFKRNEIINRNIYKYTNDGKKVIDHDATNNKLASGWHKLLVDQKVGYLVGSAVTIGYDDDKKIEPLLELLGDEFDDVMPELVKGASNKGVDWLHPFIDENGDFDYMIVPMQEFIPIYDNTKRKNLIAGIRFYDLDHDDITKVEFWDPNQVTYYEMINNSIMLDTSVEVNPASHFYYNDAGYGWSTDNKTAIPFIAFKNNNESVSDLTFYKDFIDMYDTLMSDSANTLEDVQEFFFEIKGYEGTDMGEAVTNLKRFKGVAVDEDGGINIKQGEVPMQSINSYLDRLVEDIYAQGQGVNTNTDKFGNSPSGIALKFLFSLLDMKANVLERKFTKALKEFMWFVTEYASITGRGDFEPGKVTFTFNKSMLMNERENAEIAQMSKGVISDETILKNHSWVDDVQTEKERMEEEQNAVNLDEPVNELTGEGDE